MNHLQEPIHSPAEPDSEESRRAPPLSSFARQALLKGLPVIERRMQLGGISTAVLEGGEGPPVVLLHGPGGNAAHWMRIIPALSARHRVIAPDLPGHGASQVENGALDVESVLRWLGELIEKTCASAPALVGHLLGGAMAARFAIAHGRRLYRLVLIDAFGLSDFRPAPEFAGAFSAFVAAPTAQTHQNLWRHCAHDLPSLRQQMGELWEPFEAYNLEKARSASLQAAMSQLMQSFGLSAISPTDLARIAVPTALIWGRHDLATSLTVAEAASVRYGWPLHVIENANDDPPVEQPDAVATALLSVLGEANASAHQRQISGASEKEVWR
jgi:pimeloyl-ACP methyl ester carboxylesterase